MPVLSDLEIYKLANGAFGDLGQDSVLIFGAICLAESGGNTEAVLDNVAGGWQPAGSPYQYDRGLPQINSIHGYDPIRLLSDPAYACWAGRQVFNMQGFNAWSTFKGHQYMAFLPRMAQAKLDAEAEATPPAAPVDDFRRGRQELYFGIKRDLPNIPVSQVMAWLDSLDADWGISD